MWNDMNKNMDEVTMDLNGHKQQLAEVINIASKDSIEIRQQLQQQQTITDNNFKQLSSVESHLKGVMEERIARERQTQLMTPHDALNSMTLLYQWHITDIKIKDGRWNDTRDSEVFAVTGYDCGAKASIGTYGWIRLQLIDSRKTNIPIDTKSMPKLTWVIESQSQTTQDKRLNSTQQHMLNHAIRTGFILFDESLDYGKDIYGWPPLSIDSFLRPPFVVSNGMKLSVYIDPPSMACSFFSNNGILLWRLNNYKERLQMEVDGLIEDSESPYFYTSPHGYRVLLKLQLCAKNVCGLLRFVKGQHDSSLTYEFPHRLTVTLLNHTDQSKNLVISQEGDEAYSTYFKFETVNASSLESDGYVADDSVLIKAEVEPLKKTSIFSWST